MHQRLDTHQHATFDFGTPCIDRKEKIVSHIRIGHFENGTLASVFGSHTLGRCRGIGGGGVGARGGGSARRRFFLIGAAASPLSDSESAPSSSSDEPDF
jgi:hypothetical protein